MKKKATKRREPKLKPCPFCGGKPRFTWLYEPDWVCVTCSKCKSSTTWKSKCSIAEDDWNRRVGVSRELSRAEWDKVWKQQDINFEKIVGQPPNPCELWEPIRLSLQRLVNKAIRRKG